MNAQQKEITWIERSGANSLPPVETFQAAMEAVTKQESAPTDNEPKAVEAPTDNDAWNCLLATNSRLEKRVVELEARLKQLEWVPYCERKPTRGDACSAGTVMATDGLAEYPRVWNDDDRDGLKKTTHWRPFAQPIPIDTDLVEFENWYLKNGSSYVGVKKGNMRKIWKAARAKEESK